MLNGVLSNKGRKRERLGVKTSGAINRIYVRQNGRARRTNVKPESAGGRKRNDKSAVA